MRYINVLGFVCYFLCFPIAREDEEEEESKSNPICVSAHQKGGLSISYPNKHTLNNAIYNSKDCSGIGSRLLRFSVNSS
ncbi:hypothetical protein VNO77_06265 [Canavalia gladiata]|uniref:Secreted protein n=1 Tax=Canavalia gladiata TaxID=3824 RepID=A0AAN9M7E6_CANGL